LSYSQFQTSQTGGQWYSDTSPFSIPWSIISVQSISVREKMFYKIDVIKLFPWSLTLRTNKLESLFYSFYPWQACIA
jgi:hypothetical protein